MRVLMSGGGTGGHINPAIAIADTIKRNEPDSEIAFVGTHDGKETELVPGAGYPLYYVQIKGIKRSLSLQNIKTAWYVLTAPGKAKKLINEFKPDIVIGTGGYACWPALAAAAKMGIPTMVHESNALPGLAVRKLQKQVDRILINFDQTADKLKVPREKIIKVGNPLRKGFGSVSPQVARLELGAEKYKHIVLCFGGSLGAETLNDSAFGFMQVCAAKHPEILYVHAAGTRFYQGMKSKYKGFGLDKYENIKLFDYIYNMPLWMSAADLVISRAGAITLSELSLMGKASILIPSPNVVDNHQYKNAKLLADQNAAVLLCESELKDENRYSDEILRVLADIKKCDVMRTNIKKFADKDANKHIYEIAKELVEEKQVSE